VDHNAQADADQGEHQGGDHLHAVSEALAEPAEPALAGLVVQVGETQLTLLRQLLALTPQKQSLLIEEGFCGAGYPCMMFRLLGRHSRSERFGADPSLASFFLAPFFVATEKSTKNAAFRHVAPAPASDNFAFKA
jgi:hypothetical protein